MKCEKCGNQLTSDANFCRICGTPVKREEGSSNNIDVSKQTTKIEFTDNIDVTKINVDKSKNLEDIDDVTSEITEDMDKKISAMLEITSTETQTHKISNTEEQQIDTIKYDNIVKEINDVELPKVIDNELNLDSAPGEVNDLELQSTSEIAELLSKKEDDLTLESSKTDNEEEMLKDLDAPTMYIQNGIPKLSSDSTKPEFVKVEHDDILTTKEEDNREIDKFLENSKTIITDSTKEKEITSISTTDNEQQVNIESIITPKLEDEIIPFEVKKRGKGGLAVAILVPLLLISICGAYYLWFLYTDVNGDVERISAENETLRNELEKIKDSYTEEKDISESEITPLNLNGYILKLEDIKYEINNEKVLIKYQDKEFYSEIKLDVNYDTIKQAKDDYKESYEEQDFTVKSYGTKVSEEREYVVYEIQDEEERTSLVAYSELDDGDVICFFIKVDTEVIDYDDLTIFNEVIDSLTKSDTYEKQDIYLFLDNIE